jgi:hypothetical protein
LELRIGDGGAAEVELAEHLADIDVHEEDVRTAPGQDERQLGGVGAYARKPHQLAPDLRDGALLQRLQVEAAGDGLRHAFDVAIAVADLGRPYRLQRGGGELLWGRRGVVDALAGDKGSPNAATRLARIAYARRKAVFWKRMTSITESNIESERFPFAPKL